MSAPIPNLPNDSSEALSKAALLDSPFQIQSLVASGSPPESLDVLFDLKLLDETEEGQAAFASEEIRQTVLGSIPWSKKRKLCKSLAETCLSLSASPELVARMFLLAQDHSSAREHFVKAAEIACHSHDFRSALHLMQAAFDIWPINEDPEQRRKVLKEMARCAKNCSNHKAAHLALAELLEMAETDSEPLETIELNRKLAQSATTLGDRLQARERLLAAAKLADASNLVPQSARLWRNLAQAQGDELRLRDALKSLAQSQNSARKCEDWETLSDALAYAAMLTAMIGKIQEARSLLEEALQIAVERDLAAQITNAYRRQANINEYASNYEAYRDTELAALDRCRRLNQASGTQACLTCVSYAFYRLGQYVEALEAIDEFLSGSDLNEELEAGARSVQACINALRSTTPHTLSDLENANRQNRIAGARVFEFYVHFAIGAHGVLTQQREEARTAFLDLIDFWRETDDRKDVVSGLVCAATFFADDNDAANLAVCIDILNTVNGDSESLEPQIAFSAASAEDSWLHGRAAEAIERFSEAIKGYRELKLPFEEAWLLWRLGFVQAQAGRPSDAQTSWKAAEDIAHTLSLKPLLRTIQRSRSLAPQNTNDSPTLTPRQIDIAQLLANGMTNKEAASELGISPRTVEMHVAALIERLGCRGRAEAVKTASDLGLLK